MTAIDGILVVTIKHCRDDIDLGRIEANLRDRFGCEVMVVPEGVDVKLFSKDGVYHREMLGDYEIEVFAKTEADLIARLELCEALPKPFVVEGHGVH